MEQQQILKTTYCIACGVFRTDLKDLLSTWEIHPVIEYLEGGLHAEPDTLRKTLQESINKVPESYTHIVILYGMCGKGIVGLQSGIHNLVIPRVHDCISLFLGGTAEYRKQFSRVPGTFYISAGWYEEQVQPKGKKNTPSGFPRQYIDNIDDEIMEIRYGRENADEISVFFNSWKENYTRSVFIDTGSGDKEKYEKHAKKMAKDFNWQYTRLDGSKRLIDKCFDFEIPDEEILIVPPGRKVVYDSSAGGINSVPVDQESSMFGTKTIQLGSDNRSKADKEVKKYSFGLGIDTGGTYTDAVLYDYESSSVFSRAKALTTKWKYSEGIMNAVNQLPFEDLKRVDLVSLSTTLVTNAIVESNTYPVGLLIMPWGNEKDVDMNHTPTSVIKGRMTIDGMVKEDVDPEEIRSVAKDMIQKHNVKGFAVSAYGGSVNPELELKVKSILRESTSMDVCCGHELSGTLNFYVRARTAVLNAGVIPIMEEFLDEMQIALNYVGVKAPMLVVRGDGSIMSGSYASEFPVQTALSGPAASMAGARHLTGLDNGIVADVGGTTTDLGFLENDVIAICDDGATIGNWQTHVKAVDMHTMGLGGDSEISFDRQEWIIGPRRITPFCWLDSMYSLSDSINRTSAVMDQWKESTIPMQWLYVTGKETDFPLTKQEQKILSALEQKPMMLFELSDAVNAGIWTLLRTERLEKSYCIQRAGFTPTDLYHLEERLMLWESPLLNEYFNLISLSRDIKPEKLKSLMNEKITEKMSLSLLNRIYPETGNSSVFNNRLLEKGNRWLSLKTQLNVPVIGLGVPADLMLSDSVRQLGGELVVPHDSDVANAVGAVTSKVMVSSMATIVPTAQGKFRIQGLKHDLDDFSTIEEAEDLCLIYLSNHIREKARRAGTSDSHVTVRMDNRTAEAAGGDLVFLERMFSASLSGVPDLVG